jgi:hypothetical protein
MEKMILLLRPDTTQQDALDALVEAQQDPTSPYYHQWLTPESYLSYFGVSENDRTVILDWLLSHGMQLDEVSPSGMTILFSGTVAQVEETFHTQIHAYLWNHELHYANAGDPEIPAALSTVVDGVVSLHDFRTQPLHTWSRELSPESYGDAHALTPADVASMYDLAPLYASGINGAGASIAVAERTNINLQDVRQFRSIFGLPAIDPEIFINGADPGRVGPQEEAEAVLDLEWSGALARNASIKFVVAGSTSATDGIFLAAQYIVDHNLSPVMSVNFGLCETALGTSANHLIEQLWQQAAAQGITVVVPSGNRAAAACDDASAATASGKRPVNGLASTPYNVAVDSVDFAGAAAFPMDTEAPRAAGGVSTLYAKPWWQYGKGVPSDAHRDLPDVALASHNQDIYPIYLDGRVEAMEGSSLAASSFASVMALVVQGTLMRQGNPGPTLYSLANRQELNKGASVFRKPGAGEEDAYTGYDVIIGLGSVNAYLAVTHWNDSADGDKTMGFNMSRWPGLPKQTVLALAALLSFLPLESQGEPSPSGSAPVLFYSDIDSGPATGGEGGKDGAFVCVYGENFGAAQGGSTLSISGVPAASYKLWSDPGAPYLPGHHAKACAQLSHATPSGVQTIRLTTALGARMATSNTLPFTVRAGNVYFVGCAAGASGCTPSNSNAGTAAAPFATVKKCRTTLQPGGTCYIHAGDYTAVDGPAVLWMDVSGNAVNTAHCGSAYATPCGPKAYVGYPGELVTIDATPNKAASAIATYSRTNNVSYWTFAGMTFVGQNLGATINPGTNIRIIDNNITDPGGGSDAAGLTGGGNSAQPLEYVTAYGNRIYDVGCGDPSDAAHYFDYAGAYVGAKPPGSSTYNRPRPCSWGPPTLATSAGTSVTMPGGNSGFWMPNVIYAVNPNSTPPNQTQMRRISISSTTPCAEGTRGSFSACAGYSGKTKTTTFTIDQPFSPDLTAATNVYYRMYAPAKTEHNTYFGGYTYFVDFGWNEIDGSQGRACRGFQSYHSYTPNNHDFKIHDNYIHDTVCDGINMNAMDATCGPVTIYNNLLINTGQGVSDLIADLPGGGANYSALYMSGSGSALPDFIPSTQPGTGKLVQIANIGTKGSTRYSYAMIGVFAAGTTGVSGSFTIVGSPQTTTTGIATLSANNYNSFVLPAFPSGVTSWSVVRTAGGPSQGVIGTGLPAKATFNDTGLPVMSGSPIYSKLNMCLNPATGKPLYPDEIQVYNNTIVNGGVVTETSGLQWPGSNESIGRGSGFYDLTTILALSNNIIVEPAGSTVPYWTPYQPSQSNLIAIDNLCSGEGACPSSFTSSKTGDPDFVNQAAGNFHLQSGSAAATSSLAVPFAPSDMDGLVRNFPYTVGAYAIDPETSAERSR